MNEVQLGEGISFYGFPDVLGHTYNNSPFVVNTSIISTFPEADIAGGRYRHIQLNATSIGGISGAPIFTGDHNIVVGMINGNFGYNLDGLVTRSSLGEEVISRRILTSISYATSIKTISDNTETLLDI